MTDRTIVPQNYIISDGYSIEAMNNISDWTPNGCTLSLDTTSIVGSTGIKLTNNSAGSTTRMTKSVSLDLSQMQHIEIPIYIQDITQIANFYLYLGNDTSVFTNYYVSNGYGVVGSAELHFMLQNGLNILKIRPSDLNKNGAASLNSLIKQIRLSIAPVAGGTPIFTIYPLTVNRKAIPKLVFNFDDAQSGVYDYVLPLFQSYGLHFSTYAIQSVIRTPHAGYITETQADAIYVAGNDISNHTKDHLHLSQLTDAEIEVQIQSCRDYLLGRGYTRSANFLLYPYNDYNAGVLRIAKESGVLAARGIALGVQSMPYENILTLRLFCPNITFIGSLISEICNKNAHLITEYHQVVASGATGGDANIGDIETIIKACIQQEIDIVSMSEWCAGLTNPRKSVSRTA